MSFLKSSLGQRIMSAIIIAPCFILAIIWGGMPFVVWLTLAFGIAAFEWINLAKKTPYVTPFILFGTFYILVCFISFFLIRDMMGAAACFLYLATVWMADIGAYFVGKAIGKNKLAPTISPNKTREGFLGGVLSAVIVAVLLAMFIFEVELKALIIMTVIFAVIVAITGQVGDLLVSYFKRMAGIKDTGKLIPGHGGLLDRIDSMLLAAPISLILLLVKVYVYG